MKNKLPSQFKFGHVSHILVIVYNVETLLKQIVKSIDVFLK